MTALFCFLSGLAVGVALLARRTLAAVALAKSHAATARALAVERDCWRRRCGQVAAMEAETEWPEELEVQ